MTYALISIGLLALVLAEYVSLPVFLLIEAIAAFSPFRDRLGLNFSRRTINIAVLGFSSVLLVNVIYGGASPVDQLLYFSLSLLIAKLYGPKSYRDHLQIFLICTFYLIASTLKLATLNYLFLFLLFLAIGIGYLMILNIHRDYQWSRETRNPLKRKRSPVVSPSSDYTLPGDIRHLLNWSYGLRVLGCFLAVVFVSALVFYIIPRFTLGIGSSSDLVELNTGFAESVELGDLGEIIQNNEPVMKVFLLQGRMPRSRVSPRWRGITLDEFNGTSWKVSSAMQDESEYSFVYGQTHVLDEQAIYRYGATI